MAAGAILAGGQSRRFGSDKARAMWRGQPLIVHAATALYHAGVYPILVVGGDAAGLPAGLEPVVDLYPGEGPLGGIVSALSASCDDTVVVGCDMVQIAPEALAQLARVDGPESLVIWRWRGELQPLCALYRTGAFASLAMDFAAGERSAARALERLERRELVFPDDRALFENVNTRDDLARLDAGAVPEQPA